MPTAPRRRRLLAATALAAALPLPGRAQTELIALAHQQPGKIAYGSAGNGGGTHLAGELLGGQVQLMFADAPTALPQIRAGKVRALGVASAQRSALLPELPTIAESGLPGYEAYSWAGVVAPTGTPPGIVAKISADLQRVMAQPDVKQRLYDAGAEAMPTSPERFGEMLRAEIAKWGKVVRTANIKMD